MSLVCHLCRGEVTENPESREARCDPCGTVVYPPAHGPKVVVGQQSEALARHICVVLTDAGMWPLHAARGTQVLRLLAEKSPRALVLDVALEEVKSFEIIDYVRKHDEHQDLKVVLVASVFNRTAYKRRPTSLYGADDYVEQHHIVDFLPQKLCSLLNLAGPNLAEIHERRLALEGHDGHEELAGRDRVRALARSIVSDIALYNQEDIARAARGEPAPGLHAALAEGRRMLAERIDPHSYAGEDPILDAMRVLIGELGGIG